MIQVLCGMETSGEMREAFRALGANAVSCDLLPAADLSPHHIQRDIFEVLPSQEWDIAVFHPTCTYLTCSAEWAYSNGPYHQKVKPGTLVGHERREARIAAIKEVFRLRRLSKNIPVCMYENPVGILSSVWRRPTQITQPYEHGDDASKKTCLWLLGRLDEDLPSIPIDPAKRFPGRLVEQKNGKWAERWSNQTDSGQNNLSPGEDRWSARSKTYPGIAKATAHHLMSIYLERFAL